MLFRLVLKHIYYCFLIIHELPVILKNITYIHICVYVHARTHVCMCVCLHTYTYVCTMVCLWRSGDKFQESSLHYVRPIYWMQASSLYCKYSYSLSYLVISNYPQLEFLLHFYVIPTLEIKLMASNMLDKCFSMELYP